LNFRSQEQKKEFSEVYEELMMPQVKHKRIGLREGDNKKIDSKCFRVVKSADSML